MIWDDHQGAFIGELSFRSQVRAVKLRRDKIVIALEHKVLVYDFADLRLLHQIETQANPSGIVAVSTSSDSTVLACPGLLSGQIRVELYDRRQTKFITAHENGLACLSLSLEGKRLASASVRGTLIRIWSTGEGQLLQEVRRGADPAQLFSLAFSQQSEWLAASSDKGTVHVFACGPGVSLVIPGEEDGKLWRRRVDGSTKPSFDSLSPAATADASRPTLSSTLVPAVITNTDGSNGSSNGSSNCINSKNGRNNSSNSSSNTPPLSPLAPTPLTSSLATAVTDTASGASSNGHGISHNISHSTSHSTSSPNSRPSPPSPSPPSPSPAASVFNFVKGLVPGLPLPKYFSSEWSFAQFRIPDEFPESTSALCSIITNSVSHVRPGNMSLSSSASSSSAAAASSSSAAAPSSSSSTPSSSSSSIRVYVGFGSTPNSIVTVTSSGSFYKASFDPVKGGA
eukprot:CAMPEP_0175072712 /NCGR_PEP_ID=MMETSP0052_2-20121109/20080_1 /TAXON_ID=51329 ORGANISM="Polytomella parva, Strain SAG 63-3" /NCGR_SAMPLE_ID=MMETSP0052_2 /ASSEMBLY_ACC=CAM_ASM_000194 /LENGTH=454 /DNA_ID=CAMNT_0016340283 /DNA_START=305 /DNA_END=1666 /DNA_ORIENTATION=+